ncbi:uncharacterized protein LOC114519909 [Dendronephthya gigantea]|uniref:uncharacterized protein LOC114519909 n=1 Tax=Dendronephthya gigantea TaxID=151771 RepID=UPI001069CEFC|nr:uncharacterized protein LOC114519909 [Dendronephthya gigantea]
MDAFERQDFQAAIVQNTMMYMYCCDPHYDLSFTVPSLPFFKLHGLCCHFAFHNTPSERRLCIIPNTEALLSKLNGLKSPCVINVKASTIFEFGTIPDEFIHCKAERMLLIWDFDVDRVLTENTSAVDAVTPDLMTSKLIMRTVKKMKVKKLKVMRKKSLMLYHSSALELLMNKVTNIIWNRHILPLNIMNQ